MSNLNKMSTKQKGKSKGMVVGLEVQEAPSMRKENIHRAPLSRKNKAQQSLVQGEYGDSGKSKGEVGHGISHGFQQQQPEPQHLGTEPPLGQSNHIQLKLYFAVVICGMLFSTADLFVSSAQ